MNKNQKDVKLATP